MAMSFSCRRSDDSPQPIVSSRAAPSTSTTVKAHAHAQPHIVRVMVWSARRLAALAGLAVAVIFVQSLLHRRATAATPRPPDLSAAWVESPDFAAALAQRDAALRERDEAQRLAAAADRASLAAMAKRLAAARASNASAAAAAARSAPAGGSRLLDGVASQWAEIAGLHDAGAPTAAARDARAAGVTRCFVAAAADAAAGGGVGGGAAAELWTASGGAKRLIFVHLPKCGGSALTAALRRFACAANGPASDCCENPGFCQRAKPKPRVCGALLNCHGHTPQLKLFRARPATRRVRAVAMVREPLGRAISAWHYRCHNPNWDCFDVPGATQWRSRKRANPRWFATPPPANGSGYLTFGEYLDLPHYHNVQTRMLALDRFPYDRVAVVADDVFAAIAAAEDAFAAVAVFELFDHSVALLASMAGVALDPADFARVRARHSESYAVWNPNRFKIPST